jgi:hypothetical protein
MQSKEDKQKTLAALSVLLDGARIKKLEPSSKEECLFSVVTEEGQRVTLFGTDLGWWFTVQNLLEGLWVYPTLVAMLRAAYQHSCRICLDPNMGRLLVDDRPAERVRGYKCSLCGEGFYVSLTNIRESDHPYQPYLLTSEGSQKIADWFLAPWGDIDSPDSFCADPALPMFP